MSIFFHLCLDVSGALRRTNKQLERMGFHDDDGRIPTGSEVRQFLRDQLRQGRRVIPMAKDCEGFSNIDGCPGHEKTDKA